MAQQKLFTMSFARIYPLYLAKVERKGHTKAELDEVLSWLTGLDDSGLEKAVSDGIDMQTLFERVAVLNPNATLITGMICGYRIEEIENPLTKQVRYLDKLVDELAKGRQMEKILRS